MAFVPVVLRTGDAVVEGYQLQSVGEGRHTSLNPQPRRPVMLTYTLFVSDMRSQVQLGTFSSEDRCKRFVSKIKQNPALFPEACAALSASYHAKVFQLDSEDGVRQEIITIADATE